MDIVIENKYSSIFSTLNIEISKKVDGEHTVEELIDMFKNYFFNKMFLDITAIKDYKDLSNLQKLSMYIDMDKVILLLDVDDPITKSNVFLSKLVGMGIYNFTSDKNSLMYLYDNPNEYRDVAYLQEINNDNIRVTNVKNGENALRGNVIGIKNITASAGSTTLTYLIKNVLSNYYNVLALELGGREFMYFHDKECISVTEENINSTISKYDNIDYFIVDLGKSRRDDFCSDVIYLIEPSTIKLNKLTLVNPNVFKNLNGKKIILNKSLLNDKDIATFESEANINVFYSLPPMNDKEDCSNILLPLLEKLGYVKAKLDDDDYEEVEKKKSILDIFKFNR